MERSEGSGAEDLKTLLLGSHEQERPGGVAEKTPAPTPPSHNSDSRTIDGSISTPTPSSPKSGELSQSEASIVHIAPGVEIFEEYLVEEKLGEGGMGSVWKVLNRGLDASTALKVIVEANFTEEARERLKREAQLMAQIKHPNAVRVLRSKVRRDFAFIEMEYLKGKSIDRMLERGLPMDLGWTARILDQLCGVLEYAHEKVEVKGNKVKIIHRDLKPSNLMLLDDNTGGPYFLKVLDFGIAKKLELQATGADPGEFKTNTGGALFTLPYASPEQIGGQRDVTEKSDIYSVGIMLYEFLTGYRPFEEPGLIYKQISQAPPAFAERNPRVNVPAELEQVVMRCLSKNPAERPTARELADEFLAVLPPDTIIPGPPPSRLSGEFARLSTTSGTGSRTTSTGGSRTACSSAATERAQGTGRASDRTEILTSGRPSWKDEAARSKRPQAVSSGRKSGEKISIPLIAGLLLGVVVLGVGGYVALSGSSKKEPLPVNPSPDKTPPKTITPTPPSVSKIPPGYEAVTSAGIYQDGYPRIIQRTGTEYRFIYHPGGRFRMGTDRNDPIYDQRFKGARPETINLPIDQNDLRDDLPQRDVLVTGFYIQETEVTNGEIAAFMTGRPLEDRDRWERICPPSDLRARRDRPAVCISKEVARQYARSLGGDLPTELQWEYAARSTDLAFRPFVWKKKDQFPIDLRDQLNIDTQVGAAVDCLRNVNEGLVDVTDLGVRGLMGNVREWCLDEWAPYPAEDAAARDHMNRDYKREPKGSDSPSVIRGASFRSLSDRCQTTWPRRLMKEFDEESMRQLKEFKSADDIGFRVVIPLPTSN